ncbi:pectinesterase family protein [Actinoplanes sp. NPDC026619]|uniref:pectinesterase family protein n=1 Tax=Actinoplanes sp. NPDC026619 TaxID=3155798 RepID=UPI0033DD2723
MFQARLLVVAVAAATTVLPATPATAGDTAHRLAAPVDGFAAVAGDGLATTTGGEGGRVVVATGLDDLKAYAAATEPLVIRLRGSIVVAPFGDMIKVGSDKTIIGAGPGAELVGGGLYINQQHNVIVRNLTIRDSYVPGDWDGKESTNDNDGIRIDTSHHIWIDHNRIERVGDGAIDTRKDSDFVTMSWNVIADTNKALGLGWTTNVITHITAHHNWIRNTFQRNWSIDNAAAAHLYNNYLQDIGQYGTMSRNAAKVVVQNSWFDHVNDPLVAKDATSELVQTGNVFNGSSGRRDTAGAAFDPAAFYPYTMDPADQVPAIVRAGAGPQPVRQRPQAGVVTVALDGSGDYGSLMGALGAHPRIILVKPGVYREVVRVWEDMAGVAVVGAGRSPADVVITYDLPAGGTKFYGGTYGSAGSPTFTTLGNDVTVRNLTLANSYDETVAPSQALAVRTVGDRAIFDHTRFVADQDTYKADSPNRDQVSRAYLHDCYIEGDVDFIYGRGTAVFDGCEIFSSDRGAPANNGWTTAASTSDDNPYGFLFTHSRFTSDAADGSVHLGRPWHPGGDVRALAQVVIRDSYLGPQIAAVPWTEMSGFPWQEARFFEYRNTGPGAAINENRPQLDPADAPGFTRESYLAGADNWQPWRFAGHR